MPYVPPKYPDEIPTITDLPNRADDVDWVYAARYNELKKELRAVMTELGILPKGDYADVKTRLGVEGTWTPAFTSIDAVFSMGSIDGTYIKIGNTVFFRAILATNAPATGTLTNQVYISGLPVKSNSAALNYASCFFGQIHQVDIPADAKEIKAYIIPNSDRIVIKYVKDDLPEGIMTAAEFETNGAGVMVSGHYRV